MHIALYGTGHVMFWLVIKDYQYIAVSDEHEKLYNYYIYGCKFVYNPSKESLEDTL